MYDMESLGRRDVILKTDGEPSVVALQRKVAEKRTGRTVPMNPPAYNPQSNGPVEKAVQDVNAQARCLKIALEAGIGEKIEAGAPIMKWGIQHAANLISKYSQGKDGMTPHQRLTGRRWKAPLVEFGEKVLGKMAWRKNSHKKKKLAARWIDGIWVGTVQRTGERIIITKRGRR